MDNDAWNGGAGPQSLFVCNQASWYAVSDQPNQQGEVETYPNTEYDVGGRSTCVDEAHLGLQLDHVFLL